MSDDQERLANSMSQEENFVAKFFKKRGFFIHDYEAAYHRQNKRADMLMQRVENLQREQKRKDEVFYKTIQGMDPFWRGWTREELDLLHRDLIILFLELRPIIGCENVKHGIGNISAGFSPDGKRQLDMVNEDVQTIKKVAD
ncbi:MAG: hypothetical protein KAJ73_05615, partial [Zetaproteobacteria bacterium]|nr:hypothetical protein [Zetaproteobacteria bacterium]